MGQNPGNEQLPAQKMKNLVQRLSFEKLERLIKSIGFIICLICMIFHSIYMTIQYSSYSVTAQVTVQYEEDFDPPAVSYCFTVVNTRINEAFSPESACRGIFVFVKCPDCYFNCLKEIRDKRSSIFSFLMDLKESVIGIEIKSHNESSKSLDLTSKDSMYPLMDRFVFRTYWNCIRVQYSPEAMKAGLRMNVVKEYMPADDQGEFMNITGLRTGFNEYRVGNFSADTVLVIIHEADTFPRGYWEQIMYSQFTLAFERKAYAFHITKTKYLPAPFFSKCTDQYKVALDQLEDVRNSRKNRIETQYHCIEKCLIKHMNRISGKKMIPPFETLTDLEPFEPGYINDTLSKLVMSKFYGDCLKSCPYDCDTIIYSPFLSQNGRDYPTKYEITVLNKNPTMKVEFQAKLPFSDFVIFLASIAGLWFGFCAIQSFDFTSPYLVKMLKLCTRRKQKIIQTPSVIIQNQVFLNGNPTVRFNARQTSTPVLRYNFDPFE